MHRAARIFAIRVLAVHFVLLLGVVLVVVLASREVYFNARQQAIDQAGRVQELLAGQTANGIANYYSAIFHDLDLLDTNSEELRADDPIATTRPRTLFPRRFPWNEAVAAAVLTNQLQNRVSHFLLFDRDRDGVRPSRSYMFESGPAEITANPEAIAWLAGVDKTGLSDVLTIGKERSTLLVVKGPGPPRPATRSLAMLRQPEKLLVAVVPLSFIQQRYLDRVSSRASNVTAMLVDDAGGFLTGSQRSVAGHTGDADLVTRQVAGRYLAMSRTGAVAMEQPLRVGGGTIAPELVTAKPLTVQSHQWWVVVSSPLSDVDALINKVFQRAITGGILVVLLTTAILLSTAITLIRGRLRMERLQHAMLAREVEQARRIQLAWLPESRSSADGLDIAAINLPASHISGDFYNWFDLPGEGRRTAIIIGDVTGHGMSAAFLMATAQLLLRNTMLHEQDPGRCLQIVNRHLCVQAFNGQFVTVLVMLLDRDAGTISLSSAGHYPPLIVKDGHCTPIPMHPQIVLGVDDHAEYATAKFPLDADAALVLYTDGVIDAASDEDNRFTRKGLVESLGGRRASARDMVETVIAAVSQFRRGRELVDDLTMVAVQMQPAAVAVSR